MIIFSNIGYARTIFPREKIIFPKEQVSMSDKKNQIRDSERKYLELLAETYPTANAACTEIINLQAILNLPKGTEHFLSDIHGEYEAFHHVLKNGSGVIRSKLEKLFERELTTRQIRELSTLIYYPEEKLELIKSEPDFNTEWYEVTLYRMIKLCKDVSDKYTRMKVRKALPEEFAYIIDELLYEQSAGKQSYYDNIVQTIIELDRADAFISALAKLIQRFSIDHLHILGDIYDRGSGAHRIMDMLTNYHRVDVQWGNHDILWMGAAAGSEACLTNVLRISLRYGNLVTLEQGYGISLRSLSTFAAEMYENDPCKMFMPKTGDETYSDKEIVELARMHKAILVIQLKLEGQLFKRRDDWGLKNRLLLEDIDYTKGTINLDGKTYPLNDTNFPTIDPQNPYELTDAEADVVFQLKRAFKRSEKLQQHVHFLYAKGSMYLVLNDNLLYHGCILFNEDKTFETVTVEGEKLSGKALLDRFDQLARQGYFATEPQAKIYGRDVLWYLWAGSKSPLFAKSKMATFERYFIDDKETHYESKNAYYKFRDDEDVSDMILREFGLDPAYSHIVNGHVPVKVKTGESPSKANGKLMVIDGGFSRAYQGITGIGGYTLIFNSWGMSLISHEPFSSTAEAIREGLDIVSTRDIVEYNRERIIIRDTDNGASIEIQIENLKRLLTAYRSGEISERR